MKYKKIAVELSKYVPEILSTEAFIGNIAIAIVETQEFIEKKNKEGKA